MIPKSIDPADVRSAPLQDLPTLRSRGDQEAIRRRLIGLAIAGGLVILGFAVPIWEVIKFSFSDDLFSYIPLIPLVSIFLIWDKRRSLHLDSSPVRTHAIIPIAVGALALGAYAWSWWSGWNFDKGAYLAIMMIALYSFLFACCGFFLGPRTLWAIAFPVAFLVFAVPMPAAVRTGIELFLEHGSAHVAYAFIVLTGTPVLRRDMVFELPGINIWVAPECSSIHASLMLLVTGVLAAYLFLRTPSRRIYLVAALIPLALLRNGFRIWVISELCVHIDPDMIDSPIHRHGGPIFFVLSLIPLFYWLRFLQRTESPRLPTVPPKSAG